MQAEGAALAQLIHFIMMCQLYLDAEYSEAIGCHTAAEPNTPMATEHGDNIKDAMEWAPR